MSLNLTIVVRARYLPDATTPFVLSIVGIALLLGSGWLGWALVYEHHVGIATESEIAIASRGQKDHAA